MKYCPTDVPKKVYIMGSPSFQLLVLAQIDKVLDEVDWLIAQKKSQTPADKSGSGKKPLILMLSWSNGERRTCH